MMHFYRGAIAMFGTFLSAGVAHAQQPARVVTPAPTDRAAIYSYKDNTKFWADLEARQATTKRIAEGGTFSINVRIVKPNDTPTVHGASLDIWVVQDGTAVAVTGGTMPDQQRRGDTDDYLGKQIVGGVEQKVSRGDIVFVPKGVPHVFKDMKGFHAYLIRFDTP